jgi:hypothetical protein
MWQFFCRHHRTCLGMLPSWRRLALGGSAWSLRKLGVCTRGLCIVVFSLWAMALRSGTLSIVVQLGCSACRTPKFRPIRVVELRYYFPFSPILLIGVECVFFSNLLHFPRNRLRWGIFVIQRKCVYRIFFCSCLHCTLKSSQEPARGPRRTILVHTFISITWVITLGVGVGQNWPWALGTWF